MKKTIKLELQVSEEDLRNSIQFIDSNPEHTQQIIDEYFTNDVVIDVERIQNTEHRFFHLNGFTAALITLQNATS